MVFGGWLVEKSLASVVCCGLVFGVLAGLNVDKHGDGSTRVEGGGLGLGNDGAAADRSALAAGWCLGAGDAGAG